MSAATPASPDAARHLLEAQYRESLAAVAERMFTAAGIVAAKAALRLSNSLAQLLSFLPEDRREDAWTDIEAGFRGYESESGLRIPGEQVVLTAIA
jgi:hypothetical protein